MQLDSCPISATLTLSSSLLCLLSLSNKYGIILGGNSSDSKKVFISQKKITRIMMGVKSCISHKDLFKRLQSPTFPCEYMYSLINSITNNNSLHKPTANSHAFRNAYTILGSKSSINCHWITKAL
jgi:hypothetical protein